VTRLTFSTEGRLPFLFGEACRCCCADPASELAFPPVKSLPSLIGDNRRPDADSASESAASFVFLVCLNGDADPRREAAGPSGFALSDSVPFFPPSFENLPRLFGETEPFRPDSSFVFSRLPSLSGDSDPLRRPDPASGFVLSRLPRLFGDACLGADDDSVSEFEDSFDPRPCFFGDECRLG